MTQYNGVDIVEISRIKSALDRFGERFLQRIYTPDEIRLYRKKPPSLAARFASKEAVMKLLGTGKRGICWREIETLPQSSGQPVVSLSGQAAARARQLGIREIAVSLSHSREYAIAFVSGTTGDVR